jgi:hypothetical protein
MRRIIPRRIIGAVLCTAIAVFAIGSRPALAIPSQCDATAGNLLVNCGFETADFTGWSTTPAASGSAFAVNGTEPHSGNFAAVFGGVTAGSFDTISQTIPTVPGATYQISFFVQNDSDSSPSEFRALWDGLTLIDAVNPPGFPYTSETFVRVASGAATVFEFQAYDVPSQIDLDDVVVRAVEVAAVPAPSMPWLIGIGVAMAAARFLRSRPRR